MELEFGPWLKKRRRILDLTQGDLAQRAFCSVNTIRKIESGDLMPSKALAQEIARALDIPPTLHNVFIQFARTRDATAPADAFRTERSPQGEERTAQEGERTAQEGEQTAQEGEQTAQEGERNGVRSLHEAAPALKFYAPAPITAALGREHDVSVIARTLRLPTTRLVTLTGPPGAGKTRLSLEVANELQSELEHGAAFVELAPLAHAALVEGAIAQALEVREAEQTLLRDTLRAFLRDKQLLLVLDNFEHLLDAAPLVNELLSAAPRLKILTTSRELLRVYGEREISLAPLIAPPLTPLPPLEELENYPAVQLFVERVQAVKPEFELNADNARAVARICVLLDGLPLALEMAAPRLKWETPAQLERHLAVQLGTLSARPRDVEARQRTLRGAFDWSYDLLDEQERRVLRALGVFRGSFTDAAAEAVIGANVFGALQSLVEKSLLTHTRAPDATRFELLEVIRQYALEQLTAAGELAHAQAQHAAHYRDRAQRIHTTREFGAQGKWEFFEMRDADNYRLALEWFAAHAADDALAFAFDLTGFWIDRGLTQEGRAWVTKLLPADPASEGYVNGAVALAALARAQGDFDGAVDFATRVLNRTPPADLAARARSVQILGYVALMRGEFARAQELLLTARDAFQALGWRAYQARTLNNLGLIAKDRGEFQAAEKYHRDALALRRELGLQAEIAQSLFNLAIVDFWRGEYARAIEVGREACEILYAEEDALGAGYVLETIGMALFKLKRFDEAIEALETSLGAFRRADDKRGLALILHALGDVALAQENLQTAAAYYRETLQLCAQMGERRRAAFALEGYAAVVFKQGAAARAGQLLGAANALRQEIGAPLYASERAAYDALLKDVQASLRADEFEQAWRAGQALTMTQVLAYALTNQT